MAPTPERRLAGNELAGALEVGRRIDPERHGVNDAGVDAHAVLERAQLLEPLAALKHRGRQRHEALERRPAIGIDADVMIDRPGTVVGVPTSLTTLGSVRSSSRVISTAMVAISGPAARSGSRQARATSAASEGRSPCRLRMISKLPAPSMRLTASNTRSEPEAWSGRVSTASPPAARMTALIASVSEATTTRPTSASTARRQTWTIIGVPLISASGLAGSRVDCRRAGMTTRVGGMA